MSTSHLPRDSKDRSVRARKHDPYKAKGKPREPSVCRECKTVYHKGRWTWNPVPPNSHEVVCPACARIRDGAPSGVLLLTGEFVASIGRRFSGSPAMKRPVSKPNIRWLESSRSRTKRKHPKGWSSPRPIPTSRGASARRCITHITAHSPVAMRRVKTCSGRTGRAKQRAVLISSTHLRSFTDELAPLAARA